MDKKQLKFQEKSSRLQEVAYLSFNFIATISVTLINKYCFDHVDFGFPGALCNIHFAVTWLGCEILRRLRFFDTLPNAPTPFSDANYGCLVLVVGLVTPLNNTSLKLNSLGFYQLFKLLVTPCVVFLEYIFDRKTLSSMRILSLCGLCFFVVISSQADLHFSMYGTACASIWVPLAAAYKTHWGRVKKMLGASTLQLMHALLPWAMVFQLFISFVVDPPGILDFAWTPDAIFWIGLSGLAAFLVNFSGFLVIGNISGLAHVLLGQFKTAAVCLGSVVLFGTVYPPGQLISALGAIICIVAYTQFTIAGI